MQKFEKIPVSTMEVSCDGGGGAVGHPKVYLHIDEVSGTVTCPYCSKNFVFQQPFTKRKAH